MAVKLNDCDLTPEVRKALGLPNSRKSRFTKDAVREYAIRCLSPLSNLDQKQRDRVLRHAIQINRI